MDGKALEVIRIVLLLLAIAFVVLLAYKYFAAGELRHDYFLPVVGLLFFYFLTRRGTDQN